MKTTTKQFSKGFTLVESLVAIAVLSLSITATFTAVQSGLKTSITAKNQVTAFYLAQEAMEYIKNVRDENALHSVNGTVTNWLTGLTVTSGGASGPCDYGKVCTIDSLQDTVTYCGVSLGTCPVLNQDSVSGLFSYLTGGNYRSTTFKREIRFQSVALNSSEVLVIINMSWTTEGVNKSFQVSESLYDKQ